MPSKTSPLGATAEEGQSTCVSCCGTHHYAGEEAHLIEDAKENPENMGTTEREESDVSTTCHENTTDGEDSYMDTSGEVMDTSQEYYKQFKDSLRGKNR